MADALAAPPVATRTRSAATTTTVDRIGAFVELHVEQGRGLVDLEHPVAVGTDIWPHGRWRLDFTGEANHAGTTRLEDRHDAMLGYAGAVLAAREAATTHGCVATIGKVAVTPGGVNAIPSAVTGWLDARGASRAAVRRAVADIGSDGRAVRRAGSTEESWTPSTRFDTALSRAPADPARRHTGARHRRGARRRHPRQRRHPHGDAVRPQPHRRLPLARRARRAVGLPRGCRGARPPCSRTSPARRHDRLLGRARLAAHGSGDRRPLRGGRRGLRRRPSRARPARRRRAPARASSCPAWPTRTATPSTGRCAAAPTATAATSGRGAS